MILEVQIVDKAQEPEIRGKSAKLEAVEACAQHGGQRLEEWLRCREYIGNRRVRVYPNRVFYIRELRRS